MSSLLFGHIGPLVAARLYNSYQPFFQFQERQHREMTRQKMRSLVLAA
jgi:hypothetical protein